VAEGGGLLNRYRGSTSIVSSNLIPSAKDYIFPIYAASEFVSLKGDCALFCAVARSLAERCPR
jgi:hypothetical protein